jgi:hypothetical protein
MLTHVYTNSTLCGLQLGSKDELVVDLEKEKEENVFDRT